MALFLILFNAIACAQQYKLSVCAVFQDEELFLKEWIEYHRLIGVDHFYLYNNLSKDKSLEILQPYIHEGLVELYHWDVDAKTQKEYLQLLQVPTYLHALNRAKDTSEWIAFIDIDEFIAPVHEDNLVEFLNRFKSYGALAINWQIYGTSNFYELPENELVTEKLIWKAPENFPKNEYIKYIAQPKYVKTIHDPHHFKFYPGYFAVNSNEVKMETHRGQLICVDQIRINHYWFGTKNWFLYNKLPRREKWGMALPKKQIDELINSCNIVEDTTLVRFSQKLKLSMGFTQ